MDINEDGKLLINFGLLIKKQKFTLQKIVHSKSTYNDHTFISLIISYFTIDLIIQRNYNLKI